MDNGIVFNVQRFSLHDGPGIRTIVFLKGCPLRCKWCCNPESWKAPPQLAFVPGLCTKCGKCAVVCKAAAIVPNLDGIPRVNRELCNGCGDCVKVCFPEALALYGKKYSVEEIFQEVSRDVRFYGSIGGVTASGGEALRQAPFVTALFEKCQRAGINTALETCGYVSEASLREVLKVTDLTLFDLKHMDAKRHEELTTKNNQIILRNAEIAVRDSKALLFRMPLIPSVNDDLENIRATSRFIRGLQGTSAAIELMPYHRLGVDKYCAMDMSYPLHGLAAVEAEQVEVARKGFEECEIRCSVSR